jgi:thiol:disulfide interchange protein DsbD
MERFTFSEPKVEARMKQVRLLQVDVTANNEDDRALMKKFGLLLLAVAIWMVTPVFPVAVDMLLWGAFAVLCAVFLRVFEPIAAGAGLGRHAGKTLGLVLLTGGLFELVGAASAGQDVLQPLAHLRGTQVAAAAEGKEQKFERIRTLAELDQVLASSPTPVMLDFYADWCVSCKEMERFTFSEPKVEARMKQVRLLQVDVTANNDEDRALM